MSCESRKDGSENRCTNPSRRARWNKLIEHLVLTALEPAAVELSLTAAVTRSTPRRIERHHLQAVERATYEASLARRRYEEVDPSNRLVAAELERNWESRLQTQRKAEESLNRFRQETPSTLTPEQRHSILQLASDFSMLWHSSSTTNIDRQAIVRSLIKDIVVDVVDNTERLSVTVHWAGGLKVSMRLAATCGLSTSLTVLPISRSRSSSFTTGAIPCRRSRSG